MTFRRRLPLLAATAALCALAAAAPALPVVQPTELTVTQTPAATGRVAGIDLLLGIANGTPADVALYVPGGYTASLDQAPGTNLATVAASFVSNGATSIAHGTLSSDDPSRYTNAACAPGAHAAVWIATLGVAGRPVSIPFFVDPVPSGTAGGAAYLAQACLGGVPAATPELAGLRLDGLELDFPSLFRVPPAPGLYLWRAVVTPAAADGTRNSGAAVETQALVPLPHRLTARARYDRARRQVTIAGTALAGRRGDAGSTVTILAAPPGGRPVRFGVARAGASGRFTLTKPLRRTTIFTLFVGGELFADGECEATVGPAPCSRETIAPSDRLLLHVAVSAAPKRSKAAARR